MVSKVLTKVLKGTNPIKGEAIKPEAMVPQPMVAILAVAKVVKMGRVMRTHILEKNVTIVARKITLHLTVGGHVALVGHGTIRQLSAHPKLRPQHLHLEVEVVLMVVHIEVEVGPMVDLRPRQTLQLNLMRKKPWMHKPMV